MNPDLFAAGVLLGPGLILGPVCLFGHRQARRHDEAAAAAIAAFRPTPPTPAPLPPSPGEPHPLAAVVHLDAHRRRTRRAA
ncbi:hypothetical protein [Streptomyces sp. XH2]|uniref:hypothetical protein n=1 Tax=Streptomyces sp. XH2 TaxID=3412483 RepID=UPI003C79E286